MAAAGRGHPADAGRQTSGDGRKRHAARGVRRRAALVHLALRAAADPRIPPYISGLSLDEMRGTGDGRDPSAPAVGDRVILSSLAFILGFSLVFVALGASASVIGQFLMSRLTLIGPHCRRHHRVIRPAHDGAAANWLAVSGETRADESAAGGICRRHARRHRVRLRMDALHRSDPRRHSRDCRPRRIRSGRA